MQTMDISELLKNSEGKTLEFKSNLSSPNGILRTIIAFANTAGGTILIGVEDGSNHVSGITKPLKMEEKLVSLIVDNITPQIFPEIEVVSWRNSYLLCVQVFPSSTKPHYLKQKGIEKGTYIRVGSSNRSVDKITLAGLQRIKFDDAFDKLPIIETNFEDIDFRVASELFAEVKKLNRSDLESLDLLTTNHKKKVLTMAGMILFGKNRLKHFPDAWIHAGRFAGTTKTNIVDSQEITSYPIIAIDEVLQFVQKHALHGIKINGARNTKTWNLPLTAVREAIINAIVHTDYSQQGSPIRLAIFDDRIEIESPGLLLFGLTIKDIKTGISKLRNRVIGQVFHRLGLIERWGSGITRILESCENCGFDAPIFEEIATHFKVTIFTQITNKPILDPTEQDILTALRNNDGLSTNAIAACILKSKRATRSKLLILIGKGLVIDIGKGINDPKRKYYLKL